jgi:hypothetical protein
VTLTRQWYSFAPIPLPAQTKEGYAMKLSIAVAALVAVAFVGYYVNAEPGEPKVYQVKINPTAMEPTPVAPYVPHPIVRPSDVWQVYHQPVPAALPAPAAGPVYSQPIPQPYRSVGPIEMSVVEVARELGKVLESAVQEQTITGEQASQLVNEWMVIVAVRKARIDLLRITRTLDALDQDGNCGPAWDEVRELRRLLPSREAIELKGVLSAKRDQHDPLGATRPDDATKQ